MDGYLAARGFKPQTVEMNGRSYVTWNVAGSKAPAAVSARQSETIDPELTAQIARLSAENKRLRTEARQAKLAADYAASINEGIAAGLSRHAAVAKAARNSPSGQLAFLRATNQGDLARISATASTRKINEKEELQAEAFSDLVAEHLAANPGMDRRAAIHSAARSKPKLFAAWQAANKQHYADR